MAGPAAACAADCHRYTQEIMLTNTGAIPLTYHWHMADENSPAAKDFTILPAKGTVLPYAKQKTTVEFQPTSVQRYNLTLLMDIPGVAEAAAKLPVLGECAVPIISLVPGGEHLQFGQVFLRHPYMQQLMLVNESKLPAKFEVLPQVGTGGVLLIDRHCIALTGLGADGACQRSGLAGGDRQPLVPSSA